LRQEAEIPQSGRGFGEKGNGGKGGTAKTIGNSSGFSEVIRATGGNGGDADRAISPNINGGIDGKAIHIPNTTSSLAKISYRRRKGIRGRNKKFLEYKNNTVREVAKYALEQLNK